MWLRPPNPPGGRSIQRWGIAVSLAALVVYGFIYGADDAAHSPGSDGLYTWLYARSVVFDHDLDFTNDYALCGDPFGLGARLGSVHPDNPYYIGPSLFWAPLLWLLRQVVRLGAPAPPSVIGGCTGPLPTMTFFVAPVLGAAAVFLCYRIARRYAGDGPSALAAGLFAFGGTLAAYATVMPGHSHVYATFAVALVLLATLRATEVPFKYGRWLATGLALALAILQRPPLVIWGLVPFVMAVHARALAVQPSASTVGSWWPRRFEVVKVVLILGVCAGLATCIQLGVYKYLHGTWLWQATGRHYLHLDHAHPFLVLFAPHGGLFATTPIAWLVVFGLWPALRDRASRTLVATALALAAFEIYLYSAGIDWDGSGTFGARRLTSQMPFFVVVTAILLARIQRWLTREPRRATTALGVAILSPLAFGTLGAVWALCRGLLPIDKGMSQATLFGGGTTAAWTVVDDQIGDLALLPAELVFHWRYGLPMNRFRDATEASFYVRDFKRMNFLAQRVPFADARVARTTTGFATQADGLRMVQPRARFVFAAQWPFATSLTLEATASKPVTLRMGRGHPFGKVAWFGEVVLAGVRARASVSIPAGGFDSGVNEWIFESADAPASRLVLHEIRIEDATVYPPAFPR